MYAPAQDDEITGLVGYIDQQLSALRSSAHGLTEEQAHRAPCRSTLSIGALIKHTIYVMNGALSRIADGPRLRGLTEEDATRHFESTELEEQTSVAELLVTFDEVREEFLRALREVDPGAETMEPSAPWDGREEPSAVRWRFFLVHQVEELARHAGHADIIREQIDGVTVPALMMTRENRPANAFFTPFTPEPGTITV
ncbi:hypothetical protein DEO23_09665 [Brachybacterium endophyticum]|uniref:DinB family protein n=1 Tax=Brachybacterium endophyticum TaxID=2182385 RepID=A0A2U2RJR3_9MICO|nr:DUF664 domain-containing protein [Brachybacterium endophyticum]PWH06071.1 hypothetical protein DEO23_09665 [Brachybacterium endophyticum]